MEEAVLRIYSEVPADAETSVAQDCYKSKNIYLSREDLEMSGKLFQFPNMSGNLGKI